MKAGDLSHDAVHWWELAGHDTADLVRAWAQVHHAVRLAGQVGKSWAAPHGDGQHSTMTWLSGQGLLDGLFVSEPVAGDRPMRGVIRLWNLELFLVEEQGAPIHQTELIGMLLDDARQWMIKATEQEAGPAKRTVQENQSTPEHSVIHGEPFGGLSQLAHAELIRLYSNSASVLEQISWTVDGASPVRMWPHSFEISTQVRLETEENDPPKLIVLGLAPPGELGNGGYWFVAPWRSNAQYEADEWTPLPFGKWEQRNKDLPIAVLRVQNVVSSEDPAEQHDRLARFFANAYNQCATNLMRQ